MYIRKKTILLLLMITIGGVLTLALATVAVQVTNQPVVAHTKGHAIEEIVQMSEPRAVHQATLLNTGEVLITGGCTGFCDGVQSSVEIYNPDSKTFRNVASMSEPRAAHIAVHLSDGRVLVPRDLAVATTLEDGRVLISGGHHSRQQLCLVPAMCWFLVDMQYFLKNGQLLRGW